jgi:hypothetical protein
MGPWTRTFACLCGSGGTLGVLSALVLGAAVVFVDGAVDVVP